MGSDLLLLTGFLGGAAVLASFAGVAFGRLASGSATYHAMNLGGAAALVAAGLPASAWPSVTVNVIWAAISAHGLVGRTRLSQSGACGRSPRRSWRSPSA